MRRGLGTFLFSAPMKALFLKEKSKKRAKVWGQKGLNNLPQINIERRTISYARGQ